MSEESKFTGTLKRLRKAEKGTNPATPVQSLSQPGQAPQRVSGKRSDPEWRSVTILMRKSVKKSVRRRLEDEEQGRDLSTLIDELLTRWLAGEK
jgi:hypothetical protein